MKITKSQLKELIRHTIVDLTEKTFGSKAQYDAYRKKHNLKPDSKHKVAGKTVTVRDTKKMSKKAKSLGDRMADKLNKRMADLEKKRKQGTMKNPFSKESPAYEPKQKEIDKDDVGGPSYPNVKKGVKTSKQAKGKDKPAFVKPSTTGQGYSYDEPSHADDVESNWDKSSKEFESLEDKHGVRIDDQSDWSGIENNPRGEYSVSGKNSEDPGDGFSIYSTVETGVDGESYEGNKNIITFPQDDDPFGGQVELEFNSIGDAKEALDKILGDKKIKSALDGGRADMANNKDYIKKQVEKLGGKTIRETKMAKLKDILSEAFEDRPQIDKYKVVEGVKNFGIVGKQLYNNNNIVEIAKQLSEVAESAHNHILGEQDDWFDKVSVNKNMKSLKGSVVEFQKTAKEAQALNQRLTALYEDMGHVLNRYYDIDEAHVYGHDDEDSELEEKELDKVDPSKVEPEDDFKDREDKDIDNDGDVDDSDEYLHKKRQAITKAIKKESSLGGVVGIPALGDILKGK